MKILIIDGQGGRLGKSITEQLKRLYPQQPLYALGTNSIATATMLKAGADFGATGENPILHNCPDADLIIGPIGIVIANALLGEVTPKMAEAVGSCRAQKIFLPSGKCNNQVVGTENLSVAESVQLAVQQAAAYLEKA
ncbi:MAG: DUF3842 family protein [Oscillospiraceae bacterium]|nr:DUF3842 family protein [Oscillospiraceae bacterium]